MSKPYPGLEEYVQIGWYRDLKPWGLTISEWVRPEKRPIEEWTDFAYIYKHDKTGAVHIAKTYEEQIEVHRLYRIPETPAGESFNGGKGEAQACLF